MNLPAIIYFTLFSVVIIVGLIMTIKDIKIKK